MDLTLDGLAVLRATITHPRMGAWVADVEVDTGDDLGGAVVLAAADGTTWSGTIVRGALVAGVWRGRIVGGAGGLGQVIAARAYRGAVLRTVLEDALLDAGETPDPGSAGLDVVAGLWQRTRGEAHRTVADVARAAGMVWRVTREGRVWVGEDGWEAIDGQFETLAHDPAARRIVVAGEVQGLTPGRTIQTLDDGQELARRIDSVEISVEAEATRATVWYGEAGDAADRVRAGLVALIRHTVRDQLRAAFYPAEVVEQEDDGTLHLRPDDATVPPDQGIPPRWGLPGVTATVEPGARAHLAFGALDPARPLAALWEPAAGLLELLLEAVSTLRFDAPAITLGEEASTRGAVRYQDTVDGGILKLRTVAPGHMSPPITPGLHVRYEPPTDPYGDPPTPVEAIFQAAIFTDNPASPESDGPWIEIPLRGVIDSASAKTFVE